MNHTDRAHAILSPSFMHIALKCSGSVGLKEKIPTTPPGPAAIKGTKTHELAEILLDSFLAYKLNGIIKHANEVIECEGFSEPEKKSIIDAAQGWKDAIWKECFEESLTGKAWGLEDKLVFSEKFSLWGTCDAWIISTDERAKRYGIVVDLKSGHVFVEVDKNPQLAAYAVSLRQEIRSKGKDLDYVRAAIYQPFAEGDKYRETKFTSKQLDVWEKKFLKLAEEVFGGKAKFKAGEHCKYCPCQAHCEVYGKHISKETSLALLDPNDITFPDPIGLPDSALTKIVLNSKALDAFTKACRKLVLERLFNGEKLPGIKAVEGKGRRKIDEDKADELEKFCSKFGVSPYNKKLKGIGELESAVAPMLGAKIAKERIDSFTVKNPNPILLVSDKDAREEVSSKIELLNEIEIEE